MKFKNIGNTNEKISEIGIGTWKMGIDINHEINAIKLGIKNGINFIDTAELYGTEYLVSKSIKNIERENVFIATKVSPHHFHYNDVIKACNNSLKNLNIKQIDLYQLHWPNYNIEISETMKAMEKLVDDGKIRYIGVSNFTLKELDGAQNAMKKYNIVSNQVEYNIITRGIEKDLLKYCEKEKITIIAYSPLARGSLFSKKYYKLYQFLDTIGKKYKKSATQTALNFIISGKNAIAIPKASSEKHVIENIGASGWKLNKRDLEQIENFLKNISFKEFLFEFTVN
jgi:diketogulonate reductase-like aldo/keto reductase